MLNRNELVVQDDSKDTATFIKSEITDWAYVSVNGETQVRFETKDRKAIVDFLALPEEDTGVFYLLRQRKDNPLKIKVMFANTSSAKLFTSRAAAVTHQERMTRQHGVKFTFTVVKEAK
jgi:hypothetical protein